MMAQTESSLDYRRALEALRNGVPNRDAVRVMGCGQHDVENRFADQLEAVAVNLEQNKQGEGLLVKGGFGTGKSHLLEFLEHQALSAGFVCSRVVISKETPLHDPAKVFRAAVESAVVPEVTGEAIQEIALGLRQNSPEYAEFYRWCNREEARISTIFPATLFLHERVRSDPELVEQITRFWAGERLPIARARQGLRLTGGTGIYQLKTVPVRQLALERFLFIPRLILGAGYKGWVLLIDEVELIGRYSFLQRAKSYAELARWLGRIEGEQYPGLVTVAAITDDFELAVLEEKGDRNTLGSKLRERGSQEYNVIAPRAETGMRLIEREGLMLRSPDEEALQRTYEKLKEVHAKAYGWVPPDVASAERSTRRPIRSHVRRWINEWDLKRLYPGTEVTTEEETLKPTYSEDVEMEKASEEDTEE